jgi:hypothetical protein
MNGPGVPVVQETIKHLVHIDLQTVIAGLVDRIINRSTRGIA